MMNPYAPPNRDHENAIDPALAREAHQLAKELATGGAAVGSISVRLQKLGLSSVPAEQIATEEVLAHERLESKKASVILGVGASMILFAYLLVFSEPFGRDLLRTFLFLGGGFVMLIGMVKKSRKSRVVVQVKRFGIWG